MLPALQAEERLALIEAASVPHMKAADRRETVRGYVRAAGSDVPRKAVKATPADLAAMGIRVKEVPKRG